ncbi:MAG: hypothetical protein ACQEXJ_19770 [Myxococcota bacterium]
MKTDLPDIDGEVILPAPVVRDLRSRHWRHHRAPVVITDMEVPGLALARRLSRSGVPVIGLDVKRDHWTHRSRHVHVLTSPALADPDQLVRVLEQVAEALDDRPVLFPLHDDHVLQVSRRREHLSRHYRFVMPSSDVIEAIVDKAGFARLCREHDVAAPKTFFPSTAEEIRDVARRVRYPCILKPVESRTWQTPEAGAIVGWRKAILAGDADQLVREHTRVSDLDPRVLVQEVVPGPDSNLHYVVSYVTRNGIWAGGFVGRKLRTTPPHFGRGSYVESVREPGLMALARDFVDRVGYRGNIGVEFKRDDRDGDWKIIEVNARFGMWDGFAADCGLDLIGAAYDDARGRNVAPREGYDVGRHWLNFPADFWAATGYLREGSLRPAEWAMSVLQPHVSPALSSDDPMPGLARMASFAGEVAGRGASAVGRVLRRG